MFTNTHVDSSIKVINLVLIEDCDYGNQFRREYRPNFTHDAVAAIGNLVEQQTSTFSPSQFASIAPHVMAPSAQGTMVGMINGWAERRFRFMMVVRVQKTSAVAHYIFSGFTDRADYSSQFGSIGAAHIAPDTIFFINSIVPMIQQPILFGANPNVSYVDIGRRQASQVLGPDVNVATGGASMYMMRPADVFAAEQTNLLMTDAGFNTSMDTRSMLSQPTKILTDYNNPNNFIADTCNVYLATAKQKDDYSGAMGAGYGALAGGFGDSLSANPLLNALKNLDGAYGQVRSFSANDLTRIDPTAFSDQVCGIIIRNQAQQLTKKDALTGLNSADWGTSDVIRKTAAQINQIVTSILMRYGVTEALFMVSNETLNGQFTLTFMRALSLGGPLPANYIAQLEMSLVTEVFLPLTMVDGLMYNLTGTFDFSLFGKSMLSFRYGSMEDYDFVIPSFCDSMLSPMVTNNNNALRAMSHQFTDVFSSIHQTIMPLPTDVNDLDY